MHSHLVFKESLVLSPLTPSQPGRDLSKEPKTPSTYNIYYIYIYIYMYVCIHVQYTYMYAFAKFFFYYEYSTIVFDLALVWNLISDLIYDHFL